MSVRVGGRYTIATRLVEKSFWNTQQRQKLADMLNCSITFHENFPQTIILCGGFTKDQILKVIGHCQLEVKVIEGRDNPELPWTPDWYLE